MKNSITCAGLFAGIGGFCEGFESAGFRTVWVNELDERVCDVYEKNYPHTKIYRRDVRKLSVTNDQLEPVDVLHAGFPCQSFSVAGNRQGFGDERGRLFFEIKRLIEEFGESKPKVLVLENAKHLLFGDNGNWFDRIQFTLQCLGYWVSRENCLLLNTNHHGGLPQNRERLFIIATSQGEFLDNPFIGVQPVRDRIFIEEIIDIDDRKDEAYYLDPENRYGDMLTRNLNEKNPYSIAQLRKYIVRDVPFGTCPTLTANMGRGGHNVPFLIDRHGLRKLTVEECLMMQGFSHNFVWPDGMPNSRKYEMIGNSVSPRVSKLIAEVVFRELQKLESAA